MTVLILTKRFRFLNNFLFKLNIGFTQGPMNHGDSKSPKAVKTTKCSLQPKISVIPVYAGSFAIKGKNNNNWAWFKLFKHHNSTEFPFFSFPKKGDIGQSLIRNTNRKMKFRFSLFQTLFNFLPFGLHKSHPTENYC